MGQQILKKKFDCFQILMYIIVALRHLPYQYLYQHAADAGIVCAVPSI